MKLIYRADNITEAHIVKGLLESNGIAAHVGGFYLQGGVGDLAARDFVNVHVSNEDLQDAVAIVAEYESENRPIQTERLAKEPNALYKMLLVVLASIITIVIYTVVTSQ